MYTRRQFLIAVIWSALLARPAKSIANQAEESQSATEFNSTQLETLAVVMDELIPAGDGMPAGSLAGGPAYLQYLGWQYPAIREEITQFLQILAQDSVATFRQDFQRLYREQQAKILSATEEHQSNKFWAFVGYVYESYYTDPRVLGLMWCSPSAPAIEDHEALLAPVRRLSHMYREVP